MTRGSHSGQRAGPGLERDRVAPGSVLFAAADLVDLCGRTWHGDGLLLSSHSASRRFYFVAPDTDCRLWMLAAAPGDRIRFQFRFFLVYSLTPAAPNASSPAPEDPCAPGSYLQFYEGPPGAPRPLGARLCGLTIPEPVASSGDFLGLRLVTRGRQPRVDFVGEVSSFRLGGCGLVLREGRGWGLAAGSGASVRGSPDPKSQPHKPDFHGCTDQPLTCSHTAPTPTRFPHTYTPHTPAPTPLTHTTCAQLTPRNTPGTPTCTTHTETPNPQAWRIEHSLPHTVHFMHTSSYTIPLCILPCNSHTLTFTHWLLCPGSTRLQRGRELGLW